jgi:hypothetical protein
MNDTVNDNDNGVMMPSPVRQSRDEKFNAKLPQ